MSSRNVSNITNNATFVTGLSIVLLLVGGAMLAYGFSEYQTQSDVLGDVEEVEATIIDAEVQLDEATGQTTGERDDYVDRADDDRRYALNVVFTYEYEGQQYESSYFDAVGSIPTYDERSEAMEALEDYAEGDRVTAYVPPDDPDEAFLDEEMPFVIYGLIGFGALLIIGAIWVPIAYHFDIG